MMKSRVGRLVGQCAVVVLAVSGSVPARAQQTLVAGPQIPQIITTGRGEVRASPDRATIFFAVETRATNACNCCCQRPGSDDPF